MKRTITVILTSLCALFLSCCRCDWDERNITYRIESESSNAANVTYHNEYEEKEHNSSVALPWERTFNIQFRSREYYGGGARRENYLAYLSAGVVGSGLSFPVKVLIYVDGELMRTESTTVTEPQATAYYVVRYCR